jgi:hypothetical protein
MHDLFRFPRHFGGMPRNLVRFRYAFRNQGLFAFRRESILIKENYFPTSLFHYLNPIQIMPIQSSVPFVVAAASRGRLPTMAFGDRFYDGEYPGPRSPANVNKRPEAT